MYATIVQVTGDNLSLHCLFGFVESFRARNCCRFCLTEKEDFQTEFDEDSPNIVLQTQALHEGHCQQIEANPRLQHMVGVKQSCILNSLQYFKTCDNFSVDIMHGIYLSLCPNDQNWYLLLLLLQIVNIVFSPTLSKGIAI